MNAQTHKEGWYRVQTENGQWAFAHFSEKTDVWTFKGHAIHNPEKEFTIIAEMVDPKPLTKYGQHFYDVYQRYNMNDLEDIDIIKMGERLPEKHIEVFDKVTKALDHNHTRLVSLLERRNEMLLKQQILDKDTPESEPYGASMNISAGHPEENVDTRFDNDKGKAFLHFFNQLEEPFRSQAIRNYNPKYSTIKKPKDLRDALVCGFCWAKSEGFCGFCWAKSEGYGYWYEIYKNPPIKKEEPETHTGQTKVVSQNH